LRSPSRFLLLTLALAIGAGLAFGVADPGKAVRMHVLSDA
jgi:hypothetical protein